MERNLLTTLTIFENRLEYLLPKAKEPSVLNFDEEIVSDKEIKKTDLLNGRIRLFIEQNKIPPGQFVTLLADEICQVMTFPTGTGETRKDEIKKFLDLVPFGNVRTKTYPFEKGFKIYAVNRDFYEIIEAAFEKMGFRAEATFPLEIYQKFGSVRQNSLSGPVVDSRSQNGKKETLSKNKRVIILGVAFVALIGILVATIVIVDPFNLRKPVKKIVTVAPVVEAPPVDEKREEVPKVATESLKLKILNASGQAGIAGDTREIFKTLGFTQITVGNSPATTQKSVIVYTDKISPEILEAVSVKLKEYFPTLTVSETATADSDLIFTIGRDNKKIAP